MEDEPKNSNEEISFILRLGKALHKYGYASHRLEELLEQVAVSLKLKAQFFAATTSIYCGFGEMEHQRTYLIRTEPGGINLGKLVEADEVISKVVHRKLTPTEGSVLLDKIDASPDFSSLVTLIAFTITSASASRFLGGGAKEIIVATIIGLMIGTLSYFANKYDGIGKVIDPLAAFLASILAAAISVKFGPFSVFNVTLAGLIVLLPGYSLTIAMTELTARNLVSGTSRFLGALIVFFGMGFGVALGQQISGMIFGASITGNPVPLPAWTEILALIIAPLSLAVLLSAQVKDFIWILLVCGLAVISSRIGSSYFGPELGPFLGALMVGLASRIYSHTLKRPSTVTLAPGIFLLVPGSVGFRSFASLLDKQVVPGVETAFKMLLVAMALVAGVLISNLIIPVRKR
jgi:uncharacterized membrane protein YjjP (DUF1212 family)